MGTACRPLLVCSLVVFGMGCGSKDSKLCREFKAEAKKQRIAAEQKFSTLREKVQAAMKARPTKQGSPCDLEGIDPTKHLFVTGTLNDSTPAPPHIGTILKAANTAKSCKGKGPQEPATTALDTAVAALPTARELIFVEEKREPASVDASGKLTPGRLQGRLFLWSYQEDRVLCAAQIRGMSSIEVFKNTPNPTPADLEVDLTAETLKTGHVRLLGVKP